MIKPKVQEFHSKLTELGGQDDLILLLEKKGLTTPVQWYFIKQEIDTMHQLADVIRARYDGLVQGCKMILEEGR